MVKKVKQDYFMGIDPGVSGGIAIIQGKLVIEAVTMPKHPMDLVHYMRSVLTRYDLRYCFLEEVHSMPRDRPKGAFTFGRGVGRIETILPALNIPSETIKPESWQKMLNIPTKSASRSQTQSHKEILRLRAQQMFPAFDLWAVPKSLGKQREVCDAILIAEACRRSFEKHHG